MSAIMDLLYPEQSLTCHSDSELSDMSDSLVESSLKRHSHFFLPLPTSTRSRPRSVPLLSDTDALRDIDTASPMMTVLDDSSSERIDRVSVGTDGCGDAEDNINGSDKEGIRYIPLENYLRHSFSFYF